MPAGPQNRHVEQSPAPDRRGDSTDQSTSGPSGRLAKLRRGLAESWSEDKADIARLAVQAAVASILAFLATRAAGSGEEYLAVIAAVFVLQPNRDDTFSAGWSRVVGTLIGSAIGAAALAIGPGADSLWSLGAAMLLMGGIAAWKPEWRYGVVAAAALAVGSDSGFWEAIRSRGFAILIGSAAGIASGFLVWPRSARYRTEKALAKALSICRTLLEETVAAAVADREASVSRHHGDFVRNIETARDTADSIRIGDKDRKARLCEAVHRTERLWHSLIILDRARTGGSGELLGDSAWADCVRAFQERACQGLRCSEKLRPMPEETVAALRRIQEEMDGDHRIELGSDTDLKQVAILYGLREVFGNLCEINETLSALAGEADAA